MPGENRQQAAVLPQQELIQALRAFQAAPELMIRAQNAILAENLQRLFKKPAIFDSGTFFDNVGTYNLIGSDNPSQAWLATGASTALILPIGDADSVRIRFSAAPQSAPSPCFIAFALSPEPAGANAPIPLEQFSLLGFMAMASLAAVTGIDFSSLTLTQDAFANTTLVANGLIPISGNIDPINGDVTELIDATSNPFTGEFDSLILKVSGEGNVVSNANSIIQLSEEIPTSGNRYLHLFGSIFGTDLFTFLNSNQAMLTYALIK